MLGLLFCCLHSCRIPVSEVGEYFDIVVADTGPCLTPSGEAALAVALDL